MAENGNPGAKCWCREVIISPSAIARAQRAQNNKSCICKRCAAAKESNPESSQIKALLYSTESCHLCEDAAEIVRQARVAPTIIDIVGDEKLFETYSMRIPVLRRIDNGAELDWPFDVVSVARFLI